MCACTLSARLVTKVQVSLFSCVCIIYLCAADSPGTNYVGLIKIKLGAAPPPPRSIPRPLSANGANLAFGLTRARPVVLGVSRAHKACLSFRLHSCGCSHQAPNEQRHSFVCCRPTFDRPRQTWTPVTRTTSTRRRAGAGNVCHRQKVKNCPFSPWRCCWSLLIGKVVIYNPIALPRIVLCDICAQTWN